MDPLALRIARQYLAKISYARRFQEYFADWDATGETKELARFILEVRDVIAPGGGSYAPWYHGLGTARRNALAALVREGSALLDTLGPVAVNNPSAWKAYLTRSLTEWGSKLKTLDLALKANDDDRQIDVHGWHVISMPGVTKSQVSGALEALEQATLKLKAVFPKVIYGDVYLSTNLKKGIAAWYVPGEDKFYLNVKTQKRFDDVYTIIHELGHRFDNKFMPRSVRAAFFQLSTRKVFETIVYDEDRRREVSLEVLDAVKARKEGKPVPQLSPDAVTWVSTRYTPGADVKELSATYLEGRLGDKAFVQSLMGKEDFKVPTDNLLHGPISVTPYGATKPSENIAEAFAHYVLGMDLAPEFTELLDSVR